MKKLVLVAFSACLSVLWSCTNEEMPMANEDMVPVQFTFNVEGEMDSRAISDGKGANQLMYGVYDLDNQKWVIEKVTKNNVTDLLGSGHKMSISLVRGKSYQVAFWAQNSECEAYTVSDDMKVTVNYQGVNNDEKRDAFFTTQEVKVTSNATVNVVLRRPFAQVNVGAFPFDYEYAKDMGMEVKLSGATIKAVPNQLDLLTGEATGTTDVVYGLGTIPTEDLKVDVDEDGTAEIYEWISMSYILADKLDEEKTPTTHEMSFIFNNGSESVEFSEGLTTVPVRRNYRTNIVGQILTGTISFNVTLNPAYDGEDINSAGLYYNFTEDTNIKDKVFAFNTREWATFTTENESVLNFENVTFSGKVQYIAFGDYWKKDGKVVVPFINNLKNVVAKDMVVTHSKGIVNVEAIDYMAPLVFLRGVCNVEKCTFTGTTLTNPLPQYTDYWGDLHTPLPYDCGVPNDSKATFNQCTIGRLYAWSHSEITLSNSTVEYIRCSTHNHTTPTANLTIDAGTVVDEIFVTSSGLAKRYTDENGKTHWYDDPNNRWAPRLIIKAGAKVKKLDMNGRSRYDANGNLDVIIEEGAEVLEIVNEVTAE